MLSTEILNKVSPAPKKKIPKFEVGQTVRVHQKIKEGDKERVQVYEGLIIAINSGYGVNATITVRKVVQGIGVEKVFPVFSPLIEKFEVKKKSKIRRAKLYYMRDRSGKSARLKSKFIKEGDVVMEESEVATEEAIEEAVQAQVEKEQSENTKPENPAADEKAD